MIAFLKTSVLLLAFPLIAFAAGDQQTRPRSAETERDRAYLRQQFQKNFKNIQLLGQELLREHNESRLTGERLEKNAKAINKCGKTLRTMMALGDMANTVELDENLNTAKKFDDSIRRLSELISDFAHNPVHQNSKVFNTDQAERAQTDLLTIINLSRILAGKSKAYIGIPGQNN
jgi:hypothetical protein